MTSTEATAPTFTLYSYWRSSASWRIRMALAYKNLPYAIVPVNLLLGEQHLPEYLAKNASGLVPTLVHNGVVLTQSPAILEYLDEVVPSNPLLPSDPVHRAQVRALVDIIACDTHPIQNVGVIKHVAQIQGKEGVDVAFARWVIERGFAAFERSVEKTTKKYAFGDALTMADLCLAAQYYNAVR
ncbi:hypothetical protein HDU98_006881 [Podochytrium sp. JEL0797]|nr:hypothetical protein HDU98_006881 [Podochytrium sp. JEL0797]